MLRALIAGLLTALLLAVAPLSLMAHGTEKHGEEAAKAETDLSSDTGPAGEGSPHAGLAPQLVDHKPAPGVLTVLKNLHLATVHFPIALLIFAALAEILVTQRGSERPRSAAELTAAAGGISAVIGAVLGWIHTGICLGGGSDMHLHRWIGTALGLLGPVIAWVALRSPADRGVFRLLLAAACVAVLTQGYLGGVLGHGAGNLFK